MKRKLVYIMSPSYSGSTLLTYLLATHPKISTIGELKATAMGNVANYYCSCGELILNCEFWSDVSLAMAGKGLKFSIDNFGTHYRDTHNHFCDRIMHTSVRNRYFEKIREFILNKSKYCNDKVLNKTEYNKNLIEVICEKQGGDIFLDGSKDPIRFKHMYDSGIWEMKLIFLTRDGRGATNSFMRRNKVDMKKAIKEWSYTIHGMESLVRNYPELKFMKVRYEDLCTDVKKTLNTIYEYIGIDPDLGKTEYHPEDHHILGNDMRLKSVTSIRLDEKWRNDLNQTELNQFEYGVGNINRRYGYQ